MSASLSHVASSLSRFPDPVPFDARVFSGVEPAEMLSLDRLHLITLTPAGQRPVLTGELAAELRRLILEMADQSGYQVVSLNISPARMSVLLELNGLHRPESVTRELRGVTGLRLMQSHPWLRVRLGANRMWE